MIETSPMAIPVLKQLFFTPTGAVAFGLCFRQLAYTRAFTLMGVMILASASLSVFLRIGGQSSMFSDMISDNNKGKKMSGEKKSVSVFEYREEFFV